jgi:hypothetical protein
MNSTAILDKLTLADIDLIEAELGISLGQIEGGAVLTGKLVAVFIFAVKRRTDPEYTFDMAYEMPMNEAMEIFNGTFDEATETPTTA